MISLQGQTQSPAFPDNTIAVLTDQIFCRGGWLEKTLNLEHRPQQEAMAQSVVRSFISNRPILFEAGTGVGKSLAYLIPGILNAMFLKRPFLVSSHTIALQEQIKIKDLEICRDLFSKVDALHPYKDFKVAMLVGRGNYLCGHRLLTAINTKSDLFGGSEQDDLERIAHWSTTTETGLREELNPPPSSQVWEWVNADSTSCNKRNCTHETCFYRAALMQRKQANVIIVNHSLLFSFLGAGVSPGKQARGILYPDDFVVLDEAHRVPEIASDHFGLGISSFGLTRTLKMLYNPSTKKPRGLLLKLKNREAQYAVTRAIATAEDFFNGIWRQYLQKRSIVRLHDPNWTDPILNKSLGDVAYQLKKLGQDIDNKGVKDELSDYKNKVNDYLHGINNAIELKQEDHVYWLEKTGAKGNIVHIKSAPLDVAQYLNESIFSRETAVLLTSATIATNGNIENFKNDVGAWDQDYQIENSPFDYEKNMSIYIATDAPSPTPQQGRLDIEYLADTIEFCSLRVSGGTLALFTSYADMLKVSSLLEEKIEKAGRTLYIQGQGYSRSDLKRFFVEAGNAILFGTDSFWTGFDVPGPALSQVIITRLPFVNPAHPLAEAKSEAIQSRGESPFTELMLPDAIIKFRQGIGRLIRNQSDKGLVTILDSRIIHKQYGKSFLQALPKQFYQKFNKADRANQFSAGSF